MRWQGFARRVLRPWVVLTLGLLLTAGVAVVASTQLPTRYQATARLLLLLPPESHSPPVNPFLNQPNGLVVLGSVVSTVAGSDTSHAELRRLGLHSEFEMGLDPITPIMTLSVEGHEPADVIATRDWLVARLQEELVLIQEEESTPARVTAASLVFTDEEVPHRMGGSTTRGLVGVLVAGALFTGLAVLRTARWHRAGGPGRKILRAQP